MDWCSTCMSTFSFDRFFFGFYSFDWIEIDAKHGTSCFELSSLSRERPPRPFSFPYLSPLLS